ncbi:MAG: multicopper oxidase family protein [Candidatus Bipolaricaulia bacterium]
MQALKSKIGILVSLLVVGAFLAFGVTLIVQQPSRPKPSSAQAQGVKGFTLVAQKVSWELAPGKVVQAWAYNGQVPGPELRVTEGDTVKIAFKNELPVPTSIHWHGVDVPNAMDGVPGLTQGAVRPGETFLYEFIARPAGTRFYHTHGSQMGLDEASQMDMGLYGALIIAPQEEQLSHDREYTVILDDWIVPASPHGGHESSAQMPEEGSVFTLNGKAFPATKPLVVRQGERVRLRLINVSSMSFHPMHLHGHQFKVVATDGNPVPEAAQVTKNTITVMPGESYDIEFIANNPGTWLFHCHELHHADGGMATVVQYERGG